MKVTLRKCGILLTTLLSVAISFNYSNAQITGASAVCVNGTTTLAAPSTTISGGTITNVSGYNVHTFTSAGTFVIPAGLNINAELLVVAGGGGGGYRHAGGGGAGGLIYNASSTITGSQAVVIGAGGIGGYSDPINGANGGNSSFGSFTAIGGGGGGTNNLPANSGGSGGGGSNGSLGGAGTAGQGNAGGNQGLSCCNPFGAGGGGYSAAGESTLPTVGSVGGAGFTTSMTGTSLSFAGGGGGGSNLTTNYAGGIGGGGLGANALNMTGGNGTPNTGGGGGGGGANGSTSGIGGVGGSGIVIIKYAQAVGTWTSSNTAVATVNASTGAVTGVSAGSATITYSVTVGGVVNNFTKVITCGTPTVAINNSNPSVCVGGSSTLSTQTNLVGYWKFDEGTGTTVADESGNNLNGSFASQGSNPTWASSTAFTGSGNSVQFASGYINVPDNAAINTMQSKFTIEAWIYQTDNSNNTIVDRANYNFLFEANPNGAPGLGFYNPNGGWSYSTTAIPTNQWVHVACTWDGSTNKLIFYKDGLQTDVFNRGSGLYFNAGPINIARQEPNGCQCNNMNGKIDELRLWSVVKTQAEIQSNMNQNVPVSSYGSTYTWAPATGLNTTSGSSVIASPASTTIYTVTATSAAGCTAIANTTVTVNTVTVTATNNGPKTVGSNIGFTANGAVTYAWTGPNGFASTSQNPTIVNAQLQNAGVYTVTGTSNGCTGTATTTVVVNALPASALSFGATADYVNLGSVLPANASYTKEGWIYSTDATSLNNLFSTYADPIYIPSGKINVGQGGNYGVVNDPDLFPMNQWVHVAITYDKPSTTLKLYVNGVLKGSSPNAPAFTGGLTYLGQHPSGGGQSSVKMDEVRFWSRALCQSELLNNMNCEMNPAGQQGLVALYHFNQGLINSTNTITTLTDATGNGHDGTLVGFANSGAVSNWVAGSNISGTCSVFTAVAAPITGTTTVCTGLTSTLANANAGTWTSSNTAVATISSAGIVTGVSAGTSIISFTNDCGGISTITITVNPLPTITGTLVACATTGRQLIGSGTPAVSNPWTSSNTSIATVNNTGFVTAVAAAGGSVVITYTNSNGCSITANFTVPPLPPTPTVSVVNNCNGTSTLTASGYTSYQWAIVGGQFTATGISITVSTPGTYGARSESSQCVSSFAYGIAAPKTTPVANITADGSTSVCIGNTVTLHANTGAGFSYQWLNNGNTIEGATGANYIATTSGSYTVVITNNGCSSDASNAISITIADTTPPQFTSTASILTPNVAGVVQATSAAGAQVQYTIPTAVDNCSTTVIVNAFPASGTIFPIGVTTVTVTAIDGNNNVSQTTFDITVKDTQKPIVKTLDLTVELDASGSATITPYSIENGSTDNTIIQNYSIDKSSFSCADLGANLVTLTVTDAYGNSNTGTAIITVKDFIAPQFTSSALITTPNVMGIVMATGANGAVVNFNLPTATDNCANGLTIVATPASGSVFSIGSTIVRIVATDASGNTSEIGFVMNVRGRVPAIEKPADITVNSPANQCGAAVNFAATETFGIPASVITYTEDGSPISSGANFSVGVHTITATATNAVGYTATTFTITVNDVTPPVFTSTAAILTANNAGVVQATSAAGALVMYTIPTATDNCSGNVNVNAFPASGSVFPIGVTTVTVTATDAYNNVSQTNFTVSVADTQVPTVFTQNLTIQLNASGAATINAMQIENGSTDNTIITNYILDKTNFDCSNVGANTVTLTVIDAYGNSNTGTAIVTVQDNIAPQFISSATITTANVAGVVTATSANGAVVNFTLPSATDNCANGLNVVATPASGSVFAIGTTTVTVVATDASGNRTSTSFVVKVAGVAPVIVTPGDITVNNDPGMNGAVVSYTATETTAIPASTITYSIAPGSFFTVGTHSVTATATNAVGTSHVDFNVIVVDHEKPTIATADNISANNDENACGAIVVTTAPAASDNTSIESVTGVRADGLALTAAYPVGSTVITWTAKDVNGNINSSTQTITVTDNQLPTITAPAAVTVTADAGLCSASQVALGHAVTADNCAVATTTNNAPATFPVGSTTVTWTVTDIHGNVSTATQIVTVTDDELPVIVNTPINITQVNDQGNCSAVVTWTAATATDNCPGVMISSDHQSGETFPVGTTTVTYTATDAHGHTVTSSFTITVNDTEKPTITATDKTQTADAGVCKATVTVAVPITADNCAVQSVSNSINGTNNASGVYPVGTTTITWTVTDIHSNVNTTTQTITVNDDEKPVVATQNITIQLDASGAASITPAQINNGSTDNCGIASVTLDKTSFYCSNVGANTVTLTVTDIHGNVSTATAVVTVQDKVAPIAKAKNITVGLDAVTGSATITGADVNNGSSDACGIASMTVFPSSFTCANQGANTVTLTVTDVNGNVSTTTAVVTVVDDKGPVPAVLTLPVINGQCYATALTLKPGEHEEDHDGEDNDHEGDDDDDHEGIELEHYRLVAPTAMDNCSGLITGTTTDPLTYYNQGTYIIHWKFVDAKGNVTIQLQTVIVKDNIAPTPKYATLPVIKGECSVTIGGNGKGEKGEDKGNDDNDHSNGAWAKDNCSGWIKGTTTSPLTYTVQGTYTITWDYNDGHGNISHQLQTVIVKDVTAPKINAPKDKTIACGSSILPAVTGMATATDNCSTPVISFTDVNNGTQIVRTWKATDAAGNFGTDVQVIKLTPAFSATTKSTPTSTVYTGGNNNNLYLGYGAQSTILSVTGLPAGSYTYTWTGAGLSNSTSATPVFTASAAGVTTLYVTVTNANGCSSTASISICVTDVRVPGSNGTLIYVCHQGSSKSGGTQTLSIPVAQVAAHLNNTCTNGKGGDRLGSCSSNPCNSKTDVSAVDPKTEEQIEVKPLKADVSSVTPVDEIKVTVMPNPSTTYFTLKFESKDLKTPMSLRVMDASGRAIDSKQQIDPSSTIQIGHNYPSGTFYTEVIQGNRRKVVQLIKARG